MFSCWHFVVSSPTDPLGVDFHTRGEVRAQRHPLACGRLGRPFADKTVLSLLNGPGPLVAGRFPVHMKVISGLSLCPADLGVPLHHCGAIDELPALSES